MELWLIGDWFLSNRKYFWILHYVIRNLSQYIREAYEHKERKGHPQIAWKLQETVLIV